MQVVKKYKRIPIFHFNCDKQVIHELLESYIELTDSHLRYVVEVYMQQWDSEKEMLKEEKYIYDDDVYLKSSFDSVRIGTTDAGFFTVDVYFGFTNAWVRFKKLSEAQALRNEILLWAGITQVTQ
jgi:hypothetical protein